MPVPLRRLDLSSLAPEVCEPDDLRRDDARALARRLQRGTPYARLAICRRGDKGDLVMFDVEVEIPQRTDFDIRPEEPLAVWFPAQSAPSTELAAPEVFALREGFPRGMPHTNLREYDYPQSLCVADVPFEDLRPGWTPSRYVRLVREWLRRAAIGELHAADQPLEPLLFGVGMAILPNLLRSEDVALRLSHRGSKHGQPVWMAVPPGELQDGEPPILVAAIRAQPRTHGVIHRAPKSLAELHDLLSPTDDVRGKLAAVLRRWKSDGITTEAQVAIALLVPLRRADTELPEVEQPWMFLTVQTVADVGVALGLWERGPGGLGMLIGGGGGDGGASIDVCPVLAYFDLRREDAARYNGREAPDDRRFVAIGAGSLGAQVLDAVARSAFGLWTVVDEDVLLPHNVARHRLTRITLGCEKAPAMVASVMRQSASDAQGNSWIAANVLRPGENATALAAAYATANSIIDMSASVPVARALVRDVDATARRMSLFLNPTGTDLILLAEAADRTVSLDAVEMQYYRAVRRDPALAGTLEGEVARERYGRSCRDISSQIPQARIAALAGIGAQALEWAVEERRAVIRVWRQDEVTFATAAVDVPVAPVAEQEVGGWCVVTDAGLLANVRELREAKLPNETGGVLLGHVDVARRIVYVVDTIPSPPDSQEWPTLYIRGTTGLRQDVEQATKATAGQLHYIGEWHSHPRGHSTLPSRDDLQVFAWITEALDMDDLPAVMGIVGESGMALFVGSIDPASPPTMIGDAEFGASVE